ncbi:unnamed protein product, partial [Polarella glacialis]
MQDTAFLATRPGISHESFLRTAGRPVASTRALPSPAVAVSQTSGRAGPSPGLLLSAGAGLAAGLLGLKSAPKRQRQQRQQLSSVRLKAFGISIAGTGSAAPENVISNDDLSKVMDTSDEWIMQRTGIKSRHVLKPDESLRSLGALAAKQALEAAKIAPEDVELVILATSSPDDIFGTAPALAAELGASRAIAFDLTAACSGFVFALVTASQYVRSGAVKTAVVVGADCLSRWVDWSDRGTCVLFGDGAGAVVITATSLDKDALLGFQLGSDGTGACHLGVTSTNTPVDLGNGKQGSSSSYGKLAMNGKEVFRFATQKAPE